MRRRIVIRPLADYDLDEHAEYLARSNPAAARRFQTAADKAFKSLARIPGMGGLWECSDPKFADLRVWRIRGFKKYLIFYRPLADGIEVVRVLHGSQDIESILGA